MNLTSKPNKKLYPFEVIGNLEKLATKYFNNLFDFSSARNTYGSTIKINMEELHKTYFSSIDYDLFIRNNDYVRSNIYIHIKRESSNSCYLYLINNDTSTKYRTNLYESSALGTLLTIILRKVIFNIESVLVSNKIESIANDIVDNINKEILNVLQKNQIKLNGSIEHTNRYGRSNINLKSILDIDDNELKQVTYDFTLANVDANNYKHKFLDFLVILYVHNKANEIPNLKILCSIESIRGKEITLEHNFTHFFEVKDFINYMVEKLFANTELLNKYSIKTNNKKLLTF